MWNLVNIPSGIFIVDHACETMHNACKTGALMRKFAFGANKTAWWPTVRPSPRPHPINICCSETPSVLGFSDFEKIFLGIQDPRTPSFGRSAYHKIAIWQAHNHGNQIIFGC